MAEPRLEINFLSVDVNKPTLRAVPRLPSRRKADKKPAFASSSDGQRDDDKDDGVDNRRGNYCACGGHSVPSSSSENGFGALCPNRSICASCRGSLGSPAFSYARDISDG